MAKRTKSVTLAEIKAKIPEALGKLKDPKCKKVNIGAGPYTVLTVFDTGLMRWYAKIPTDQRDAKGKKKTKWIPLGSFTMDLATKEHGGMSLESARKKASDACKKEAKAQHYHEPGEKPDCPTLAEYWPQYVKTKRDQGCDPHGWLPNLRSIFNLHLAPLHSARLDDLNPATVAPQIQNLDPSDHSQGNNAHAIDLLIAMLDMAVNQGIITVNPCHPLNKVFRAPKTIGFKFVAAERLADVVFKPLSGIPVLYRFFYLLLALTGTRKTEMLNLRWSWVDEMKGVITAPAGFTKTKTHDHEMPITPQLHGLLSNLKEYCKAMPESDVVFQGEKPEKVISGVIEEPFRAHCKGICTIHGFRSSINTWMVENGIDSKVADLYLTHDTRNKVQKAYNHAKYGKEIREAAEKWDAYLETQLPPAYLELIHGMK